MDLPEVQEIKYLLNKKFGKIHDSKLILELANIGSLVSVEKGTTILKEGQTIDSVPLVLEGLIKVKRSKGYDDIFLYFLTMGESCAMTLSSCLKREKSRVSAVVDLPAKILLIPSHKVFFFMKNYLSWSEFVINTFQDKFDDTVKVIERLAFMSLDQQILDYLHKFSKAYGSTILHITHQSIADDLCTSRVIVSRILKKMEREGKIKLGHKLIKITQL